MHYWLLVPPIAFFVVWAAMAGLELATRPLAPHGAASEGKTKAYACGEDPETNRVQPDYAEFFPCAFFFTIMHVVVLMVATVPPGKLTGVPIIYVVAAVCGLFILYREKVQADVARLFGGK